MSTPDPGVRNGEQPPIDSVARLVEVMDHLRSPGGCPWDAEQTHESLVTYLLEETHELVEAIEAGDRAAMREELGDVLLQVVFHSRIAQEHPTDPWSLTEVAEGIVEKLVARHPHVFADEHAPTAAHVESTWLLRKTREKARESVLDGIPPRLPALMLASKTVSRASHGGVAVAPAPPDVLQAAEEALSTVGPDGVGLLLLALVSQCHDMGLDPEAKLRVALRDYAAAVRSAEAARTAVSNPLAPFAQQERRDPNL